MLLYVASFKRLIWSRNLKHDFLWVWRASRFSRKNTRPRCRSCSARSPCAFRKTPRSPLDPLGWKFQQQKHGFVRVKQNVLNMNGGWMGWDEIDAWAFDIIDVIDVVPHCYLTTFKTWRMMKEMFKSRSCNGHSSKIMSTCGSSTFRLVWQMVAFNWKFEFLKATDFGCIRTAESVSGGTLWKSTLSCMFGISLDEQIWTI